MHKQTIDWYDSNAAAYFAETAHLDSASLLDDFLDMVNPSLPILDLGCGSGRDLRTMRMKGFTAFGIEPAHGLAELARRHSGAEVIETRVEDAGIAEDTLGGVWACASLLHVDAQTLPGALARIHRWLKPGGIFFTSFKDGEGESIDARGRRFTNLTLDATGRLVREAGFELHDLWHNESIVPGRIQLWNSVLARKR